MAKIARTSDSGFTPLELRKIRALKTPYGIQRFLNETPYHLARSAWSPRRVLHGRTSHCLEGAIFAAAALRVPSSTMFDYEWATLQHQLGCRAATRVVVPEAIPPERLERYGVHPPKLRRYPGLKEEYYLSDFQPDRSVATALGIDEGRVLVIVRTPPDVSLYHRASNPLFPRVLDHLGRHPDVQAVVIPRTEEQRDYVQSLELPSLIVPDRDAAAKQSLDEAGLKAQIQKAVDSVNSNLGSWETIKYFTLLPEDFTEQTGELSLKLDVKRKVVALHYQDQIESMYLGKAKP